MRQLVIISYLIFHFGIAMAQDYSDWTVHLPYRKAKQLVASENRIFCLTESGVFSFSLNDNEIVAYNKTNGLSDSGVSAIQWSDSYQMLIVAYDNGNLDLITESGIVNLPQIKNYTLIAEKRINSISVDGTTAYLGTDFGIVALNLDKREISDTYFIGNNGSDLQVNHVVVDVNDNIWAATENGMYRADKNSNNLSDFNNWEQLTNLPNFNSSFTDLAILNEDLFALSSTMGNSYEIFKIDKDGTSTPFLNSTESINSIKAFNGSLYVAFNQSVKVYNTSGNVIEEFANENILNARDIALINNRLFIADYTNSLLENQNGTFISRRPDGPLTKNITNIYSVGKRTWTSAGAYSAAYDNAFVDAELFLYKDNRWFNFTKTEIPEFADKYDLVALEGYQLNENKLYAASWGDGLYVLENEELIAHYNSDNSPLGTKGINSMTTDESGNLWLLDAMSNQPVKVLSSKGEWISLSYNNINNQVDARKIISLSNGDKWVLRAPGSLLFAFNENGSLSNGDDDVSASFSVRDENNAVISSKIYDILEDKNENLWLATASGIAIYANPGNVFRDGDFYAYRPIITVDGSTQYLLSTEQVNCIEMNGANQKWLGTKNSGAYLISDDGESQLNHFTMDNSPLPSNNIKKISVNPETGEVFFVTDNGMVSYLGKVTEGTEDFKNLYVYPNPVRETYHGSVIVSGLMSNSIVKISDVSGNLVWEGESEGGQFVWDGKNFNRNRVHTGVYLIFCSNQDGSKSKVIKLLFIH